MNQISSNRIAAIDWMRGLVMILMVIDHASLTWNSGRLAADSAYLLNPDSGLPLWVSGNPLDTFQFFTRWITHLCAPTFVFLTGTSLAMSLAKRRSMGMSALEFDRHLLIRALVLFACEGVISLISGMGEPFLQVLFAIGASMLAMVFLRRLPTQLLVGLGLAWLAGSELLLSSLYPFAADAGGAEPSIFQLTFFTAGTKGSLFVLYPMTHWLAMMMIGWGFGQMLVTRPDTDEAKQNTEKMLIFVGLSSLLLWAYLRSENGYGNMGLYRDDTTIVQWLHMSKYPPALVYSLMELGIMALGLLLFMRFERRMTGSPRRGNLLTVFGQTALFFYMLHFILLGGAAAIIAGGLQLRGLTETYIAAAITIVVLYPVCIAYRSFRKKHPTSVLQYF